MFILITSIPTPHSELRMATIKETPCNLIIQDAPTATECIRRVRSSHAERILDVRMSATSQMTTEHAFRLEQATELASRIRRVPLLRIEAEATYRHYIHISSYFLLITTFRPKRAKNL